MTDALKRTLGPIMIWGLGVGYVISGSYFGWNLGLPAGGPYGMLAAAVVVTILYVSFVLGYAELACALPRAGGAFVYSSRALGPHFGFLGGAAQLVEYVFAPPAIAFAIGSYLNQVTGAPILWIAFAAYIVFTAINVAGVKLSASFELVITVLAVIEILIFGAVCLPQFSMEKFSADPLPNGWMGAFAALPFAIWFYLAIEGVANLGEEAKNPQRDLSRGFLTAMATLVILASIAFFGAIGVDGWRSVVYPPGATDPSDSPLPLAIGHVVGRDHLLFKVLTSVGLLGLVASFHGILIAASRAIMEYGRVGYAPKVLGRTHRTLKTPVAALLANMVVGVIALLTGKTGDIILLSVFGALTLYAIGSISLIALRKREPDLPRPYKTPLYPLPPIIALVLSLICMAAMVWSHPKLTLVYAGILAVTYALFRVFVPKDKHVLR